MAWIFELAAEFGGNYEEAIKFGKHFDKLKWELSNGLKIVNKFYETDVWETEEKAWWCRISPIGVSRSGISDENDAKEMTELGILLYEQLKAAPDFRFALVGVEVEEFRTYNELIIEPWIKDANCCSINGLVICKQLWKQMGSPSIFLPFKKGYYWRPYKGEICEH